MVYKALPPCGAFQEVVDPGLGRRLAQVQLGIRLGLRRLQHLLQTLAVDRVTSRRGVIHPQTVRKQRRVAISGHGRFPAFKKASKISLGHDGFRDENIWTILFHVTHNARTGFFFFKELWLSHHDDLFI